MSLGADLNPQQAQILRAVRQAGDDWSEAMRVHTLAPPDAGFAYRLRALAVAAAREQVAWEHAHAAGLPWRPVPDATHGQPPYELRPGTGRRGPDGLWTRFDQAVAALNKAIAGTDAAAVADAFGELSDVTGALADAVTKEDAAAAQQGRRRNIGAA
jgi:hypothetical protein